MIKVTIVIPYPEIQAMAAEILAEVERPGIECGIIHAYGTKLDGHRLGDSDIILARGLTQQAIKRQFPRATVLELAISAFDIIRAIHECRQAHAARKIAVIGSDSIFYDVDALKEIVNVDLGVFRIRDEAEILAALGEAGRQGFDAVAGGLTACTMATGLGWRATFIRTGEESLRGAIKEAVNAAAVMRSERAKAEISNAILRNSRDAILYFDQSGTLALHNRRAREMLLLPPDERLAGRRVEEVFADADIRELVAAGREARGVVKNINQAVFISDFAPVRVGEQVIGVICTFQRANEIQAAENKIRRELHKKGLVAKYGFDDIIHASPVLAGAIATARKYGDADANVLLMGETGTGKEIFAQSIHNASRRRDGPFVAVNCASFPENLLESELFGYAEGAFSGALKGGRIGLFELAHRGTLFLDEIGEMPLNLQATLLRALQEGEIRKIGDDRVIPVNARIIAATNRDLGRLAGEGGFRMDLLYRLDVLSLAIPPLRERREDIALIAGHYLKRYRLKYNKPGLGLSPRIWKEFDAYGWPGNIRELKNLCERLVVLGDEDGEVPWERVASAMALNRSILEKETLAGKPVAGQDPDGLGQLVKFVDSMRVNKADLASMLGISRTTLWRRLQKSNERAVET